MGGRGGKEGREWEGGGRGETGGRKERRTEEEWGQGMK